MTEWEADAKAIAFADLVRRHDLSYSMSDDHSVWQAGEASIKKIRELAKELFPGEAARIWNERIDEAFKNAPQGYRDGWYWKGGM